MNGSEFGAAFHWHLLDAGVDHVKIKRRTTVPAFVATDTSGSLFSDVRGWHSVVVGSIYSRLFALSYDSFVAWGERAGMQTLRRSALAEATGSVLEIGAGTGLNAALSPPTWSASP